MLSLNAPSLRLQHLKSILESIQHPNFALKRKNLDDLTLLLDLALKLNVGEAQSAQAIAIDIVWALQSKIKSINSKSYEFLGKLIDVVIFVSVDLPKETHDPAIQRFVLPDGSGRTLLNLALDEDLPIPWFSALLNAMPGLSGVLDIQGQSVFYKSIMERWKARYTQVSSQLVRHNAILEKLMMCFVHFDKNAFLLAAALEDVCFFKMSLAKIGALNEPALSEKIGFFSFQDGDGCTPVILALQYGNYGIAEQLIKSKYMKESTANLKDNTGSCALHYARDINVAQALFLCSPDMVFQENHRGFIPLQSLMSAPTSDKQLATVSGEFLRYFLYSVLYKYVDSHRERKESIYNMLAKVRAWALDSNLMLSDGATDGLFDDVMSDLSCLKVPRQQKEKTKKQSKRKELHEPSIVEASSKATQKIVSGEGADSERQHPNYSAFIPRSGNMGAAQEAVSSSAAHGAFVEFGAGPRMVEPWQTDPPPPSTGVASLPNVNTNMNDFSSDVALPGQSVLVFSKDAAVATRGVSDPSLGCSDWLLDLAGVHRVVPGLELVDEAEADLVGPPATPPNLKP